MAITIPVGCYQQPTESEGKTEAGVLTYNYVLKGPYTALKTLAGSIGPGDVVVGVYKARHWTLQRNPGGLGTLTIDCTSNPEPSAVEGSSVAESEIWELKSVRNDVSILAYCGTSNSNPQRALIEAWQQEPDGRLAQEHKFRDGNGDVQGITDTPTLDLIGKIEKGISAVLRFYPVITVTRVFSSAPKGVYTGLATISTPTGGPVKSDGEGSAAVERREKPDGIAAVVQAHQWLKCQDDVTKGSDGKWTRTQSWMGCLASEGGWDANLYGVANRWPMPYAYIGGTS